MAEIRANKTPDFLWNKGLSETDERVLGRVERHHTTTDRPTARQDPPTPAPVLDPGVPVGGMGRRSLELVSRLVSRPVSRLVEE